jgi:hypothetical protein
MISEPEPEPPTGTGVEAADRNRSRSRRPEPASRTGTGTGTADRNRSRSRRPEPASRTGTGTGGGDPARGVPGPPGAERFKVGDQPPGHVGGVAARVPRDGPAQRAQVVEDSLDPCGQVGGRAKLPAEGLRDSRDGDVGAGCDVADRDTRAWFHQGEDSRIKRYRQRLTSLMWRAKLCGKPARPRRLSRPGDIVRR